jgi:hypothetical protein
MIVGVYRISQFFFFCLGTKLVRINGFSDRTYCWFMVSTRSQHYRYIYLQASEVQSSDFLDVELMILPIRFFSLL